MKNVEWNFEVLLLFKRIDFKHAPLEIACACTLYAPCVLFKKRKFEKDRYSSYFQSKAYKVSQRCIRSNVSSNVLHAFTHSVMAGLRFGGTTTPTSVLVKGQKTSSCLVPKEKDPPSVLAFDHSVRLPALTVSETFQWPPWKSTTA